MDAADIDAEWRAVLLDGLPGREIERGSADRERRRQVALQRLLRMRRNGQGKR